MDLRHALEREILRFRTWAETIPTAERSGEWECLYDGWQAIYRAFGAFVSTTACQEWDQALTQLVLYIIARDNDIGHLVRDAAQHPGNLMCLAERALTSPERDARWQLAAALGRIQGHTTQAEMLLLRYVGDTDEYVRRCSVMALADIGSSAIGELVTSAWESKDEYMRMAVLYALWRTKSPQLDAYLMRADADGQQVLMAYAQRIRSGDLT